MIQSSKGGLYHMRTFFENITDSRQSWKTTHNLHEVIVMTICAVISGCDIWEEIVDFCKVKEQWFRDRLKLSLTNGIASHDTFQRVFQLINPDEMEKSFVSWVKSIAVKVKGEIISIDGKTVCGSRDIETKAIHMVGAWANTAGVGLGQVKTDEKSNEITAIPKLLDLLDISDCIITIDAMGCQKTIAEKIIKTQADYVFGLKGNQSSLHDDVRLYFETMAAPKEAVTKEKSRNRVRKKAATVLK